MAREFTYRTEPTKQCPYPLVLTPQPHYVSASHKIIEIILVNNFGKKNIPPCIWWRQSDPHTPVTVYNFQKSYWPTVKRLLKTYDDEVVIAMVESRRLKWLSPKLIAKYLYWCKITQTKMKQKPEEFRYNKEDTIVVEDSPVIEIEKQEDENLRDWLD